MQLTQLEKMSDLSKYHRVGDSRVSRVTVASFGVDYRVFSVYQC